MTETTTVQVAHVDAKSQRIKAALEIKLSKVPAQPKALMLIIGDEYHAHQKEYSDMRVKWSSSKVTKSTFDALIKKGLLQLGMLQTQLSFTDIGRELAIFLLIEPARKEMEYDFEARAEEAKRKSLQWVMKAKIMKAYKLEEWEVYVQCDHSWEHDDSYDYTVALSQAAKPLRDGSPPNDCYVKITRYRDNDLEISVSGSGYPVTAAKRMAELMLIACQIIESGLLEVVPDGDGIGVIELELLDKLSRKGTTCIDLNLAAWIVREKPAIERLRSDGYISGKGGVIEITEAGQTILNRSQ